jgi:hypothetical protein
MNPYWLRAVRISALCMFLMIFAPRTLMYGSLLTHYDPADSSSERLQWAFFPFLLWFPYFQVFWRLRDISDSERVKKALARLEASPGWNAQNHLPERNGALLRVHAEVSSKTCLTPPTLLEIAIYRHITSSHRRNV